MSQTHTDTDVEFNTIKSDVYQTLSLNMSFDNTDNKRMPTSGSSVIATVSQTGGSLKGANKYTKHSVQAKRFIPVSEKLTAALRLKYEEVNSQEGFIPFYDSLFIGVNSVRGYERYEFKGNALYALNAELRWKFSRIFGATLFADYGDIFNCSSSRFRKFESAGLGLNYFTRFGVFRLEHARGYDECNQTYFGFGYFF